MVMATDMIRNVLEGSLVSSGGHGEHQAGTFHLGELREELCQRGGREGAREEVFIDGKNGTTGELRNVFKGRGWGLGFGCRHSLQDGFTRLYKYCSSLQCGPAKMMRRFVLVFGSLSLLPKRGQREADRMTGVNRYRSRRAVGVLAVHRLPTNAHTAGQ